MLVLSPIPYHELLMMEIPPQEWLIEGLVPQGSLALLSAREKAGKGLLTIDAAVSVALGEPFLGMPTKQGKAIYLAAEESLSEVKARLQARVPERTEPPIQLIHLDGSFDGRLDLTDYEHVKSLWDCVDVHKPDFLIIDVLREVHTAKEDSSDEMSPVMKELRGLARQSGCTILVNHHMSKAGYSRGSTAIQGGVDVLLDLNGTTDHGGQLAGTLTARGRGVPRTEMNIQFDGISKWLTTNAPYESAKPKVTSKDIIHGFLEAQDRHVSVVDIVESTGIPEKTVSNTIGKMKQEDPELLDEITDSGKGSPRKYKLREASISSA